MKFIYRLISSLVFLFCRIYGRSRARAGSELWRGRLGLIETNNTVDIWIHASSIGETKVATYLSDYLLSHRPDLHIYLSTMTEAGQKVARTIVSKNVMTGFLPLDHPRPLSRTLEILKPKIMVITETELWPNLIGQVSKRNIEIVLVNGRMSESAFRKYKLARKMFREILKRYRKLFLKTDSDKRRFGFFGVKGEQAVVAGDMKFDAPLLARSEGRIQEIRSRIGAFENDFLFVCGSTRPGEEQLLLELARTLKNNALPIKLVLAPRHIDRIKQLQEDLSVSGDSVGLYSEGKLNSSLILVDRMGCLNDLYLAANLAFVGGTLVNIGGHNLLEPVWAGTSVLFGQSTGNVNEAKNYILDNNYGAMAADIAEMTKMVRQFINGEISFAIKSSDDLSDSATSIAGDYILQRLSDV
ncbi:MAG: glycosyltransferase N-terminal domain-containing protein [candidate division Zixibacteria bacterium]